MQGTDETLSRPDFDGIEKFFSNIDFLVPGHDRSSQYMVAIHREFYEWARSWVTDKVVLDAGCGEGYGAATLAESAARVVGIDLKPELIQHAQRRYQRPNLRFEVMDCEAMSFEAEAFDVVVSNEVIEHLPDYRAFMDDAYRLLRRGGLFLCATTNAAITFAKPDGSPMNRNHYQEFTPASFRAELEQQYEDVSLYSEAMRSRSERFILDPKARGLEWILVKLGVKHKIPIRWRNRVRERITGVRVEDLISEGFEIREGTTEDCLYVIGLGRKP